MTGALILKLLKLLKIVKFSYFPRKAWSVFPNKSNKATDRSTFHHSVTEYVLKWFCVHSMTIHSFTSAIYNDCNNCMIRVIAAILRLPNNLTDKFL